MIKEKEILSLIESELTENEMFLVSLSIATGNKITVEIDSMNGASVQDCIKFSRIIESGLDREKEDFELMVSTPGLSSPLKVEQQYKKVLGKGVEINLTAGGKIKGTLVNYDKESVEIETKKKVVPEGKKKKIEVTEVNKHLLTDIKSIIQQISLK